MIRNSTWIIQQVSTIVFLICLAFLAAAQKSSLGMPFITSYKAADYNGESQNWAFVQNDDGIMFIANTIGFIEYDGVSWRHFKPDNDGIPLSFAKDKTGRIYSGGTGFIGELKSDSTGQMFFESLSGYLPQDFFIDFVWSTHFLNERVYFQNKANIMVWNGENISIIESPADIELLIKSDNRLFVDTKSALFELVDNKLISLDWADELNNFTIRSVNQLSGDSLLIGTFSNGLFLYNGSELEYLNNEVSDFFKKGLLPSSMKLPDGKIIMATKKGGALILNKDHSVYYRIIDAGGLANNDIKNFYLDYNNNIWIGTDNGFSILEYPIEFTLFNSMLGVESTVEEIRSYQKNIFIGSFLGVLELNRKTSGELLGDYPYAEFKKLDASGLTNMAVFEFGDRLLIGTTNGTQRYDGKELELFDNKEARKFYRSDKNKDVVYAGYRNGCDVLIFNEGELIKRIPVANLDAQIRGIAEDTNGKVWLGSLSNGIYRVSFNSEFESTKLEHFTEDDGVPSMRDNLVYRVGKKVIFTTHKGIFSFNEESNRFFPDSIFGKTYADDSRFVYAFYYDNENNAWINSFRKKETALATLNEVGKYNTDIETFTPLHNMQIYEIYKEPGGAAWFGGSDGLARYEPVSFSKSNKQFKALIRKVIVNSDSVLYFGHRNSDLTKPILKPGDNEIRFETAALYFEDGNEYKYFLDGNDEDWSAWSREPFKIYTNLGHGEYLFRVRARNIKKHLSATDNFYFQIIPPWYYTWLFMTVVFIVAILFMYFIIRYFATRKLIRRVEELELIQKAHKQRERISRDLHDNVGSNLTYIISSLDYITYKSSKDGDLSEKANNLSDFTRDTMHQLRDTIWHISSEEVTLKKFLGRVEELCLRLRDINESTSCEVHSRGDLSYVLPPLPALNLFRVIQESVNNAFKHAVAKNIKVEISIDDSRNLSIIIEDDGVGFNIKEASSNGHYGLINMESRMADIGATLDIQSRIGAGTVVEVALKM
jgi:signal transduction histidine kinase/ligand-binding sensor domain-containing protein